MDTKQKLATISKDVAVALWGEPNARLSKGDKLRWGNKGSKSLEADKGVWKDFEADTGGGVLTLIERECQTDREGAKKWLRDNGYWVGSPISRNVGRSARRSARPIRQRRARAKRPRTAQQPTDSDKLAWARTLWAQSEPIGKDANHPFRRWATVGDKPGILHPFCRVPAPIRWSRYRGGVIIAGVFPLKAWGKDGIPKGEPVAVQALGIDQDGQNRFCLGEHRNLRRCSYGDLFAGVLVLGDPTSERVNIVEGIADALAVYSRAPGAVLATLGTFKTLEKKPDVIDHLCTRETWLYSDNDKNKAGDNGAEALIKHIHKNSPGAVVRKPTGRASGDPGDWAKRTPFVEIEQYDFEEKSGMFFDSGLSWGEADRMTVQLLTRGSEQ